MSILTWQACGRGKENRRPTRRRVDGENCIGAFLELHGLKGVDCCSWEHQQSRLHFGTPFPDGLSSRDSGHKGSKDVREVQGGSWCLLKVIPRDAVKELWVRVEVQISSYSLPFYDQSRGPFCLINCHLDMASPQLFWSRRVSY